MKQVIYDCLAGLMVLVLMSISVIVGLYIDTFFGIRIIAFAISIGGIYLSLAIVHDFAYSNRNVY